MAVSGASVKLPTHKPSTSPFANREDSSSADSSPRHEPVGIVSGMARVGHRHGRHQHHIVVIADGSAGARGLALLRLPQVEGLRGARHGGAQRLDAGARELLRSGLRQVAAKGDIAGSLVIGQGLLTMRLQPQRGVQGRRRPRVGESRKPTPLPRATRPARGRRRRRRHPDGPAGRSPPRRRRCSRRCGVRCSSSGRRRTAIRRRRRARDRRCETSRRTTPLGRGIVLVVAAEESAARFGARTPDQQLARPRPAAHRRRVHRRCESPSQREACRSSAGPDAVVRDWR